MSRTPWGPKDPDAIRDYGVDWTDDAPEGETVVTSTWLLDDVSWTGVAGVTNVSTSIDSDGLGTIVRISGGTAGDRYEVTNHVVFSDGQEDDWTETLKIKAR